jgi:hypothetical protein
MSAPWPDHVCATPEDGMGHVAFGRPGQIEMGVELPLVFHELAIPLVAADAAFTVGMSPEAARLLARWLLEAADEVDRWEAKTYPSETAP